MKLKLSFEIEIDETEFKNIKKNEIKEVAKEAQDDNELIAKITEKISYVLENIELNR